MRFPPSRIKKTDGRGEHQLEGSLWKMMTGGKRSATLLGSGYPQGNSLVAQVSGGTLACPSSAAPSSNDKPYFRG